MSRGSRIERRGKVGLMDLNSYLAVIRPEAALLAATADEAGLDAPVPTYSGLDHRRPRVAHR